MNRKTASGMMVTLLLIGTLTLASNTKPAVGSSTTRLYLDPTSIVDPTQTPGNCFTVDVEISDVLDLYGWQVNMSFDPNILKIINVIEGDFLKDQPLGSLWWPGRITESWAIFGACTLGDYLGVDGSGTLATIEFLVLGIGESVINIDHPRDTFLLDSWLIDIPCEKENGYFFNGVVPATVEIYPETLSLHSLFGKRITAYIELPEGYDVSDIDISTVRLNNEVPAETHPTSIGDYDDDGISDLMVKFSRIEAMKSIFRTGENTLTISGVVAGRTFKGGDTIRVNNPH